MEEKKGSNILNYIFLIVGTIFLLFASTYCFTRPFFLKSFNFSETGQIGDTIGGITAPVINLIGAVLVFISFRTQIRANKIQFKLLNNEINNQKYDRNFQVVLDLFNSLKEDYREIKNGESIGQAALNDFINIIHEHKDSDNRFFKHLISLPIYSQWKFLIVELDMVYFHLEQSSFREVEKEKLNTLIKNYYKIKLEPQTNAIKKMLEINDTDLAIVKIISKINSKY